MAADISEITDSNQIGPEDIAQRLDHIVTDLHDAIKMLRAQGVLQAKHDALLEEFRPLLDTYRAPLASMIGRRRRDRA